MKYRLSWPVPCVAILVITSTFDTIFALPAPQWVGAEGDDESNGGAPLRGSSTLLGQIANEINTSSSGDVPQSSYQLVDGQEVAADIGVPFRFDNVHNPQPIRGGEGSTDPGPRTYGYDRLNPDTIAPPGSDKGEVPQGKWPMGLSHNRILPGHAGWSRQQNEQVLPVATAMAGVDMKLAPGAYRELHWHQVKNPYLAKYPMKIRSYDLTSSPGKRVESNSKRECPCPNDN